jgi:16S rRNA processing protein RimM
MWLSDVAQVVALMSETDDLITIARIARTRGLRGEVLADLLTDFPERFDALATVSGVALNGSSRSLQIEEHWFQRHRIVLKFTGFDSIEAASELVGYELKIPIDDRVKLEAGQFYEWELVGCRVETVNGQLIGVTREVMHTGGVEILVVTNEVSREFLIPMAQEICVEMDVVGKLIRVDPPEGLLEL